MVKDTNCPICLGQYEKIGRAEFVCYRHESWFITTCSVCGRQVFASQVGLCNSPRCSGNGNGGSWGKGKKDYRASLRTNGQDSW